VASDREPFRAVLLDVDGTLLDANRSIRDTMNRVLAEERLPTFGAGEVERLIGNPLRVILSAKCPDRAVVERMAHRYRALYSEVGWVLARPFPGIEDLLGDLRAHGVLTGIVTSKGQRETEVLLRDLGLADRFDAVVGDDDVRPLKPDPAPVLAGCTALGVAPHEAAMVGDTRFDILSGKAAGANAVGVLWGNGSRQELVESGADELARDVKELCRILL